MIKGITVTLFDQVPTGADPFGKVLYDEIPTNVENVLVSPLTAEEIVSAQQLDGCHAEYELCIPKGDMHTWRNRRVRIWDEDYRTVGPVKKWQEEQLPLDWNKKVKVERFG